MSLGINFVLPNRWKVKENVPRRLGIIFSHFHYYFLVLQNIPKNRIGIKRAYANLEFIKYVH
jgi:hypothetical protein